jgi:hypothetical protein
VSQKEIHLRLVSAYGQEVFIRKVVSVWCDKFTDGRIGLNDDAEKY